MLCRLTLTAEACSDPARTDCRGGSPPLATGTTGVNRLLLFLYFFEPSRTFNLYFAMLAQLFIHSSFNLRADRSRQQRHCLPVRPSMLGFVGLGWNGSAYGLAILNGRTRYLSLSFMMICLDH